MPEHEATAITSEHAQLLHHETPERRWAQSLYSPYQARAVLAEYDFKGYLEKMLIHDHELLFRGNGDQALMVAGMYHNSNPDNPLKWVLCDAWSEWIGATKNNPEKRVVLIEGGVRCPHPGDVRNETLMQPGGEQAFIVQAAFTSEIPCISAEPPNRQEFLDAALDPSLMPADIVRYMYLRYSRQLAYEGRSQYQAETFMRHAVQKYEDDLTSDTSSPFYGHDFSLEAFLEDYEETYGKPYKLTDWREHLHETVDHMYGPPEECDCHETKVMYASQLVNRGRDQHFIALTTKLWQQGYSVFFAPGFEHMQVIAEPLSELGEPIDSELLTGYQEMTIEKAYKFAHSLGMDEVAKNAVERFLAGKGRLSPH